MAQISQPNTQRNLPASLLKCAAANLAIQALGKNLNKKNFLPTLVVGALGGGLSCLSDDKYCSTLIATSIFGGGNALINKTSVPKSLAKYAAIGTTARLMLNIPEIVAKTSEISGDWITIYNFKLPNGDLPKYKQINEAMGCTHTVLRSISDYLGYSSIANQLLKEEKKLAKDEGIDFSDLAESKGYLVQNLANNLFTVGTKLNQNIPVAVTYQPWLGRRPHTVGINQVEYQQNASNKKRTRFIIKVMDPLLGNITELSQSEFNNGIVRCINGR